MTASGNTTGLEQPSSHQDRSWLFAAAALGAVAGSLVLLVPIHPLAALAMLGGVVILAGLLLGWPFSGVVLLASAALLTHFRVDVGPVTVRPEHVAAVGVAGLGFLQLGLARRRLHMPAAAWLALGWVGMNGLSGLWVHPDPRMGLQNTLRIGLAVLTFILVLNLIPDMQSWRRAVSFFLAAGVVEAAYGILARAVFPWGINLGVQVAWNFTEPVPYGTFEEGNLFGSHSASWAIALLMIYLAGRRVRDARRRQALRILGLGILWVAVLLSMSRAAWIMLAVGVTAVIVFEHRSSWSQINRLLLALMASPLLVLVILSVTPYLPSTWPFVNRLQSFLNLEYDPTFSARLADWTLAMQDWREHPWTGWGPGAFYAIHGMLRAHPAWISNLTVRLLHETGLLGLLLFGGYVVALILPGVKVARAQEDGMLRGMLLGLVISYVALIGLAYQSTDGIWLAASWVHAGLIAAAVRLYGRDVGRLFLDNHLAQNIFLRNL